MTTGITPAIGWSIIIRYSNAVLSGDKFPIGSKAGKYFAFDIVSSGILYANGGFVLVAPTLTTGVIAIGGNQGYRNGVADGGIISSGSGLFGAIFIGCLNNNGNPEYYFNGYEQAIAIYNTSISAAQVLAVTNAMNAL
jgi:hypothetical protein